MLAFPDIQFANFILLAELCLRNAQQGRGSLRFQSLGKDTLQISSSWPEEMALWVRVLTVQA